VRFVASFPLVEDGELLVVVRQAVAAELDDCVAYLEDCYTALRAEGATLNASIILSEKHQAPRRLSPYEAGPYLGRV
jgi:hypothetical protein